MSSMGTPGIVLIAGLTLLVSYVPKTNANMWHIPDIPENQTDVLERWIELDKGIKQAAHSLLEHWMPKIIDATRRKNISGECVDQTLHLLSALQGLELWAVSFVDSSAKGFDGILSGAISFHGAHGQCLDTVALNPRKKEEELYRGKYCTIYARPPLPPKTKRYKLHEEVEALRNFSGTEALTFLKKYASLTYFMPYHVGVCIPSGCSEDDLNQLLEIVSEKIIISLNVEYCETKEDKVHFSDIQVFTIVLGCFLGVTVLVATWLDKTQKEGDDYDNGTCCQILRCFSLKYNFHRLTSTKTSADSLKCIYGIRFLSITWIIEGHCYVYAGWFFRSYSFIFRAEKVGQESVAQMVVNGSEAVDSFFFMAGLLVCYLTLKLVKREKRKFSLKLYIFHRLWRIIPTYYFVVLLATLAPLMGSGPLFHETMSESLEPCKIYWWRNLLFINNFFHLGDMCMMHTWFISCEMQLYFATLLVLIPMLKSEKLGVAVTIVLIVASVIYTGVINYLIETAPSVLLNYPDPEDKNLSLWLTYGNPLSRAGPYFIGVLTGYLVYKFPNAKISKKKLVVGWCLATVCSATTIFLPAAWYNIRAPSDFEILMYATFYKVAYTAGVAWMTFCCITGHGGFINDLLSWKVWVPLSKLSFIIYLVQPVYQTIFIANFKTTEEVSHLHFVTQFFGYLCVSGLISMVLNLVVESPSLRMEKIILGRVFREEKENEREEEKEKDDAVHGIPDDLQHSIPTVTMESVKDASLEFGATNLSYEDKYD